MDFNNFKKTDKAYLILENGTILEGKSFGEKGTIIGEAVFTTSMTGYQEALTDSAYKGQLLIQTFPLIGNYGINEEDFESDKVSAGGYIVREYCEEPSNFRCLSTINSFLKKYGIIGLYDVDTRFLTKILRKNGVMKAMLTTEEEKLNNALDEISAYRFEKFLDKVSVVKKEEYFIENPIFDVAIIDYGYKNSLRREFNRLGCNVTVYPFNTTAEELETADPDGIVFSGGPGNPSDYITEIKEIKNLFDKNIPLFGVALGHQLMALARGGKTSKHKYGHRGGNQPVIDLENGRTYITSQNHGYIVDADSLKETVTHINANDKTCEGLRYKDSMAFSVQFYPESHGGINDTAYLFSEFILLMNEYKK